MLRPFGLTDKEKRVTLAFVCLLTAVGVPMILAGEEFADQHDFFDENGHVNQNGGKQVDPVDFSRFTGPVDEKNEQERGSSSRCRSASSCTSRGWSSSGLGTPLWR